MFLFTVMFYLGLAPITGLYASPANTYDQNQQLIAIGKQAYESKDYDRAIQLGLAALQINPKDAEAYQLIARSSFNKKDFMKLIMIVNAAETSGVVNPDLYDLQALAFFFLNQYDASLGTLAKIERLRAHDSNTP